MKIRVIGITILTFMLLSLLTAILMDKVVMPRVVRLHRTVVVPDLQGLSMEEVIQKLQEKGLVFEFAGEVITDKYPPGVAIEQEPLPGMIVKEGRRVKVVFSKSPHSQHPIPKVSLPEEFFDTSDTSIK